MDVLRRAWAIVWKDLLIEARTKQSFNAMVFFAALVLFIFSFALGPDTELLRRVAGGLLWVGITFTGVLSLSRTYQSEETSGGLEGLRLYPGDVRSIYLGKLFGNVILLLLVEAVLFPAAGILFQLELWPHAVPLTAIALLGTIGFSIIGTFYAALTVNLRAREVMLPLLLFPALVPVLLGAVNATMLVTTGDAMGEIDPWIRLLVAFDVIFFVICTWIFPIALEE
jgi:heme exporter protein B